MDNNRNVRRLFEVSPQKNLSSRIRIQEALLKNVDTPISLVIPSYVPDIAECHGQYPIDQVEEAETFAQMMEYFPQKEQ